jgi:hypothetical protein
MSIVRVEEDIQPLKYLVVTQQRDPESVITTNVVISDTRNNRINLVSIEKGLQGDIGLVGPKGDPGKDGVIFDVLPINSGGTNNTIFSSGHVIYYDGSKLSSSNYTIQDILNNAGNSSNLTGIIAESGLYVNLVNNNARLGVKTGGGLTINEQNTIVVDDTIVRKVELNLGSIEGVVPIEKGGTNNQLFNSNRLLYYDGFKIASFPLATGRILLSGTTIDIVAGSGLVGGGLTSLPSGSVVLNIGGSSDILVETNSISLSNTGIAGTYNKITTDEKGRVVSGSNLSASDIISILNYTPWHIGNDGENSGLDADLLDGQQGSYYLDLSNSTGILSADSLPVQSAPGLYTKVQVNNKGIVINGQDINYGDIVNALGYRPVSATGDIIYGPLTINGNTTLDGNDLVVKDNLPLLGTNSPFILPNEPRGFSFMYGGLTPQTGILAYYPGERELRLITNIGATGIVDAGSGDNFNNEVDGGDANSVYVIGNITGDMNIVLLRSVADSLYVSRFADQTISGNKTFADPLAVRGQISVIPNINQSTPPFNVGANTRMVENLNVDLLHGKNLDYYNDASNMTGLFNYEKVQFNSLEGTIGFIPRFDNRTNNPSRTISDSVIQQTGQIVRVNNNFNFSVGTSNTGSFDANRSALIGQNNRIIGDNSLAVGSNNLVNANNSIALNSKSQALTDNSIAAGNHGYTWSENQVSFGSFRELNNISTAQGQHSTITLGLSGVQTDGAWVNMSPSINIPKNKTLSYTLEVLMNKAAGTGAALFTYESGIIKNSTFRNPNNPSFLTNITSILKDATKREIYNDSQRRRYYYHFNLDNNNFIQNLDVTAPDIKTLDIKPYNTESLYKYIPQYIESYGTYEKTNDGELVLNIPKPITYGWFYQNSGSPDIIVKSYFHGMTTGSVSRLNFTSATKHTPFSKQYQVSSIISDTLFSVKETSWSGRLTNDELILDPQVVSDIDSKNSIITNAGFLYTNSPDIYNVPTNITNVLHTGMYVRYYPHGSGYSYVVPQTGKIIAKTSSSITFDTPFTGLTIFNQSINTQAVLEFTQYTRHVFDSSKTVHLNISGYGQQSLTSLSGAYAASYCGQPTYSIKLSGIPNNIFTDTIATIRPATTNSGTVSLVSHRNISGTYTRDATQYKKYEGIYIRQPSISGNSRISIYNQNLEPIELPSVPFNYSFVCGYGDDDNGSFEIYKSGLYSYLKFKSVSGIDISLSCGQDFDYVYKVANLMDVSYIKNYLYGIDYDLQQSGCYFYSQYPVNSGAGYVFYPDTLETSDLTALPLGLLPDKTYFPVNIKLVNSSYIFDLSKSSGGQPITIINDNNRKSSYKIFPRIRDAYNKDIYNIRIKVFDMSGRNYEKPFSIHIDPVNVRTHIRNSIPDQSAIINELFTYTIPNNTFPNKTKISSVRLSDGRVLPQWLAFDQSKQAFSGTPLAANSGTIELLVKATGVDLIVSDVFKLSVTDSYPSISNYIVDPVLSFDIKNIFLSSISVPQNASYDTHVGKLSADGGYNPYLIFKTSSNSFNGYSHFGGNVLTECSASISQFSTVTLSGIIPYLSGHNILVSGTNNQSQQIVSKIVPSSIFNITVSSGSNFLLFNNPNSNYTGIIFSGNKIFSNIQNWDNNYYATNVTTTGIYLNRNFTNLNSESTGLTCFTSGYNILLNSNVNFTDNIIGIFSTPINESGFYYIDQLKNFTTNYQSATRCPVTLSNNDNIKGFDTETNEYIIEKGYYSTGLISFYTDVGYSDISISSPEHLNFENDESSVYLRFLSRNTGVLPTSQGYSKISGIARSSFNVNNGYFFPNSQPYATGSVLVNVDKNHGYKLANNNIINQIPVQFLDTQENNSNRKPKNNLFDIDDVEGNTIYVKDKNNYLLKEIGKPDYFEQAISGIYTTNGFGFSAAFVHNDYKIYDLDYGGSPIWPQDKIIDVNSSLGSSSSSFVSNSRLLDFTQGFFFNGTVARSGSHIVYNGTFPSLVYSGYVMSVFSTDPLWPTTGITVGYNGYNYSPLSVSFNTGIPKVFNTHGLGSTVSPINIQCTGLISQSTYGDMRIALLGYDYQIVNISGSYSPPSGSNFVISKTNQDSSETTLFSSSNNSNINIQVTGWPKEIISLKLYKNNDQLNFSTLNININSTFHPINIGKRLDILNAIDNINTDYVDAMFYFKPIITLDQRVCLNNKYRQPDNRVFFNGNQITIHNLSTPRSYLNTNDQIKILSLNSGIDFIDSAVSRNCRVVGTGVNNTAIYCIPNNGPKIVSPNSIYNSDDLWRRNSLRYAHSFGIRANQELPNTGIISFVGAVSGYFSIPQTNNLYHHTYGGYTANWPMDPYGKRVSAPLTGVFSIQSNSSQCVSGTLCLSIKGFSNTNFNSIPDLTNRSGIGKQPHAIDTDAVKGYIRPWGTANKKYYFDFSDNAPELNGLYYINDKTDPYNITINIPYNINYLGRSGLVYIIDSDYNIKSNINPNIDNSFVLSESNASVVTDTIPPQPVALIDYKINSYSLKSKRWKHLVHFNNPTSIPYSGYNITFDSSQQQVSQLLYLNPDKINILNIDYSMDYGESYTQLDQNKIKIKTTDENPIYLRIQTKDGSQKWSQSLLSSAPKINIHGLNTYSIDTNTISYNNQNKIWTITAIIDNIKNITTNRDISVVASDETGTDSTNLIIDLTKIPEIAVPKVTYTYVNSPIPWSVNYDIKYLPDPYLIVMSGYPGPSFNINNETFNNSTGVKILYGNAGSVTGVFNTTLSVKDYITGENLSSQTGVIRVLAMNQTKPGYTLDPIGLPDDIYLNIDNDNSSSSFYFYVDAINTSQTSLLVTLTQDVGYTRNIITEYSNVSNRYKITVSLVGSAGYYSNKSITVSLLQPQVNSEDVEVWVPYTYTKLVNITLYKTLTIDRYTLPQPLSFDKQDTWFLQFYLLGGIFSHRPDQAPSVRLSNLPNKGTYPNDPLEYNIRYEYDNADKRWKVIATGRSDNFARMTDSLGVKSIKIFAEDSINTAADTINLTFTQNRYLTNLQPVTYSIPNEFYQTTFDVRQASANNSIMISLPANLREDTIDLSLVNQQYDPDLLLHQFSYSGSPIYDKWDTSISFGNINTSLNDNQLSSITVRCKGISSDKIYAIGKLSLMELDSLTLPGLPIKITGVARPNYSAKEGSPWRITFKTLHGLENPNFPPTILLSGLPTVCSGYYPSLPLEQQNGCLESRNWSPSDKSWNFAFTGFPLCGIDGVKPFSITAIDTDTIQNISLSFDTINAAIDYTSLDEEGFVHPVPQIVPVGQVADPIQLSPRCSEPPINISYRFGPQNRATCPIPTGITGWIVSASGGNNLLPSGLSYTISFPGGSPKRPWNNLGSGTLTITGDPLFFASGTEYAEKLILTDFDARGKSIQKIIKFTDISSPNPPSPIDLPIYFDSEKPIYTRRLPGQNNITNPSGTTPIDWQSYPDLPLVYWPAANANNLKCDSILPHNQCLVTSFAYSGANFQTFDFRVFIKPERPILSAGSTVYVEFDNNPGHNRNNRYQLSSQGNFPNIQYFITADGHDLGTGIGRLVQERTPRFNTQNIQKFLGNTDITTTRSLLGCGSFASKSSVQEAGFGLFGRMYPSIQATIPSGEVFSSQIEGNPPPVPLANLSLSTLDNMYTSGVPQISTVKTFDCWQTGYLRISGILLPSPSVELTDPAPAAEAPFAYNGQQYFIGSRCVYGSNPDDRNLIGNKRDVNIDYKLKNILSNSTYAQGSVGPNQAISFNHTENTGTVFSLFINNTPSIFPTYRSNAIRYAENEYFWVHKGGTKNQSITQNSFPPVVIGGLKDIHALSGTSISGYSITAVGGYIPFNEYSTPIPYYRLPDGSNWSTSNYPPFITGVIQSRVAVENSITYSHSGSSNSQYQFIQSSLLSNPYNIEVGDTIYISFPGTDIPAQTIALGVNNISNNTLLIPYSRVDKPAILNGAAKFSFLSSVTGIESSSIFIKHKNLPLVTGDSIDVVWSSGSSFNSIAPLTNSMTVSSFNSTSAVVSYNGVGSSFSSGLSIGHSVDIYKNYHNEINIGSLTFSKEGYWLFSLSGIPTNVYKDYRYKIVTVENSGMPVFSGTDLVAKKYVSLHNTYISKPIKILLNNNYSIPNNNGVWTLSFSVDGGSRPIKNNTPEIMINNSICNFNRTLNSLTMQDSYDVENDRWNITIGNNNNYDWRYDGSFELKVFDDTGFDTKTILFSNG